MFTLVEFFKVIKISHKVWIITTIQLIVILKFLYILYDVILSLICFISIWIFMSLLLIIIIIIIILTIIHFWITQIHPGFILLRILQIFIKKFLSSGNITLWSLLLLSRLILFILLLLLLSIERGLVRLLMLLLLSKPISHIISWIMLQPSHICNNLSTNIR